MPTDKVPLGRPASATSSNHPSSLALSAVSLHLRIHIFLFLTRLPGFVFGFHGGYTLLYSR